MSDRGKPTFSLPPLIDPDYGIVLHAYVQLPLFTREDNGAWVAPLKRFNMCELRLVECVAATPGEPVLRVELVDRRSQTVVESRSCEELEEAVGAFKAMIPLAEAFAAIPHHCGRCGDTPEQQDDSAN